MIEISFLAGELCFTAVWLIARVIVWIVNKKIDLKREAMLLLMYINLAVIIRFTFYPLAPVQGKIQPLVFDPDNILPFNLNLIPLRNMFHFNTAKDTIVNVSGNIMMFIPSGIILPVLYKKLDRFWKVLTAGAFISLSIELLQLLLADRHTNIDDVILNVTGVAIGCGIYALARHIKQKAS